MGPLFYRSILTLASVVHTTRRAFIPSPRHIGAAHPQAPAQAGNSKDQDPAKTARPAADEGTGYPCFSFFMPQTPEQRGIKSRREPVDTGSSGIGAGAAGGCSQISGEGGSEARSVGEKGADEGKRE